MNGNDVMNNHEQNEMIKKSPVPAPRMSKESNTNESCDYDVTTPSRDYDVIRSKFDQSYKISNLRKSYITPF